MQSGVYAVQCIANSKFYIGSSKKVPLRLATHKTQLRHKNHVNADMVHDFHQYGEDAFRFDFIMAIADEHEYLREENRLIEHYAAEGKCYNKVFVPSASYKKFDDRNAQPHGMTPMELINIGHARHGRGWKKLLAKETGWSYWTLHRAAKGTIEISPKLEIAINSLPPKKPPQHPRSKCHAK